jgi:hypothetical protein
MSSRRGKSRVLKAGRVHKTARRKPRLGDGQRHKVKVRWVEPEKKKREGER